MADDKKTFSQAFAAARKKFRADPTEGNYTFTWEGKKYNILQKGETKSEVMSKYGKSPDKSPRPKARPSKSESGSSSSDKPKKRLGYESDKDTTDDARASRGSGRTAGNDRVKMEDGEVVAKGVPVDDSKRVERGQGSPRRQSNKPKDSRSQLERDRDRMKEKLGKVKDFLFPGRDYAKVPIGEWKPEKKAKGGLVGASIPPAQKSTPKYKK